LPAATEGFDQINRRHQARTLQLNGVALLIQGFGLRRRHVEIIVSGAGDGRFARFNPPVKIGNSTDGPADQ
jgi:hypothetical protein